MLNRKLFRELRASGGLLSTIAGIVAVGVACFVSMRFAYHNLSNAKRRYYAQCRMADFSIELKKMPLPELSLLDEVPGISELRPRIQFAVTVDLEGVVKPLNGLALSLPESRKPIINDIVLRRGSYFTDRRAEEVILNDAFARQHGLHPGDFIHLILNNRRQELFVVGTAISSEFVYLVGPGSLVPDPEHFGIFYLKRQYMEEVFDFEGACNQVVGLLAPSRRAGPKMVLDRAELLLDPFGVFATIPREEQSSNRYLSDEIRGLAIFANVMPVIFLAVAALVLNVLMTRLTQQHRTVIGTLKAIGYTDAQLLWHYLMFGSVVGVLGGLVGCAAGYWLAGQMTVIYRRFFEFPELASGFYPGVAAIGMLFSIACAVLGTARGARAVLRLEPAEAMRPEPPRQGGAVWIERAAGLWRRLGTGWRMVLRNVIRNRRRTVVGLFAAVMGTALLVSGFILQEAVFFLVDFQFQRVLRSDMDLAFKDEHGYDAVLEARRLPGVDYAEPVLHVACTFVNGSHEKRGGIMGLLRGARLSVPRDDEGRRVRIPETGLVMTKKMAEVLHVRRGDSLTVIPTKGLRKPLVVRVVVIADSYLGLDVYANIDFLSRLVNEELAVTGVQLQTDRNPRHKRALYRELKRLPALEGATARADVVGNLMDTFVETNQFSIALLVVFAGVIFFGSTLNASLISLSERRREVATMLALGYNRYYVGRLFLRECLVVNLAGTLLGLPVGYLLSELIARLYDTELFRIPVVSPPWVWISTVGLSVAFSLVSHAVLQWTINRMNWLDRLKINE